MIQILEVVEPEGSPDEVDTVALTEEDNVTNEVVADTPVIEETVPSVDDGEIGGTTSQESQPDTPPEDGDISEPADPEIVPDVPEEDGGMAIEKTPPDAPVEADETTNPENVPDVPADADEISDTAIPENLPDAPMEDNAPLPTAENPPTENSPQAPPEHTTPVILIEKTIPDRPFPSITISLPTFWPSTITTNFIDTSPPGDTNMCKENEIYSCLPFCMKTCNNPMSKFLCRPVPNHFRLCRRGCTCKMGYLMENPNGRCVKECPARQLF